jgi:hypothetical protein
MEQFVSIHISEYGKEKSIEISSKVHNSNAAKEFLRRAEIAKFRPKADDYMTATHSNINFTFSKPESIAVACLVLLCKWEISVGKKFGLADDDYLKITFFTILDKCDKYKTHLSNKPNFFDKVNYQISEMLEDKVNTRNSGNLRIVGLDQLLNALTVCNREMKKLSGLVEKNIFWGKLISPDVPREYQEREIKIYENFANRFIISSGIIGMAVIEYVLKRDYSDEVFQDSLREFKCFVLKNMVPIRLKILEMDMSEYIILDDKETIIEISDDLMDKFYDQITDKAEDLKGLIENGKEVRNIYYHFCQGLGQLLPSKRGIYFQPDFSSKVDLALNELVEGIGVFLENSIN